MEFARYFKNKGQESARANSGASKETLKNLNWLCERPGTRGAPPEQPGERPVTRSIARRPCSRQSAEPQRALAPDGESMLIGSARERSVEAAAEAGRRGQGIQKPAAVGGPGKSPSPRLQRGEERPGAPSFHRRTLYEAFRGGFGTIKRGSDSLCNGGEEGGGNDSSLPEVRKTGNTSVSHLPARRASVIKDGKLGNDNSQIDCFSGVKASGGSLVAQRTLYSSKGFSGPVKESSSSLKGASPRGVYAVGTSNYDVRD